MGKEIVGPEASDDTRVSDWEIGLPSDEDLTPLSIHLVPPELASAFSITPSDIKTMLDVHRASQHTIHNLTARQKPYLSPPVHESPKPFESDEENCAMDLDAEDPDESPLSETSGRLPENSGEDQDQRAALKRPRLVWTPQLHKRFVDVVAHLGTKNAVPKTIMQLMNVDGLTRENVASHLQKYRNHLKRMQGFPNEGNSSSDHVFGSSALQQNLKQQQQQQQQPRPGSMRVAYTLPTMIPMPIYAFPQHQSRGVVPLNNHRGGAPCSGFDAYDPYATNN